MKIALIITAFIFPFACIAQQSINDWHKESLRGKVKTIRCYSESSANVAELRKKSFNTNEHWDWVDSFSNTGRKLSIYRIFSGVVTDTSALKYDAKGNIIEVREVELETKRTTFHITYAYDATGNVIQEQSYDDEGNPGRCVKYMYGSGLVTKQEISTYGDTERTAYKYNNKGQIIEDVTYPSCGWGTVCIYTYDDKGNKISAIFKSSGSKITWKYDEYNNELLEEHFDTDGTIISSLATEYSYDRHGNWIRRLRDTTGRYVSLSVREIEYY